MAKLIQAGAKIIYLSNALPEEIKEQTSSSKITYYQDNFDEKYLQNIWLVVCGSNDVKLKSKIAQATKKRNIFCNFVDEAPISSFISPAVISKGDITIAISTKGKSPALNKYLKNEILERIGDEYILLTEILGKARHHVIEKVPDQKGRAELFDSIVQNPEVMRMIRENNRMQAEQYINLLIKKAIDKPELMENSKTK
jgi:precorrin-2 dehydrogenase/sirohydrochlorin ferrochelatase